MKTKLQMAVENLNKKEQEREKIINDALSYVMGRFPFILISAFFCFSLLTFIVSIFMFIWADTVVAFKVSSTSFLLMVVLIFINKGVRSIVKDRIIKELNSKNK